MLQIRHHIRLLRWRRQRRVRVLIGVMMVRMHLIVVGGCLQAARYTVNATIRMTIWQLLLLLLRSCIATTSVVITVIAWMLVQRCSIKHVRGIIWNGHIWCIRQRRINVTYAFQTIRSQALKYIAKLEKIYK